MYNIKDIELAEKGKMLVEWAQNRMPVLDKIRKRFEKEKPLSGVRIGASLHVTKETAVLMKTLLSGGAEIALCASNPLSTSDEVAAALVEEGIRVFAWRGETEEEYFNNIRRVIEFDPMLTMDDGGDLTIMLHRKEFELKRVKGGTEETTTGVNRIKALEKAGKLRYPVIAVNNAYTKYLFDNRYGTGQSVIDGIMRATSTLLAGKTMVVAGYGWCGKGVAMRARGMGMRVIVTEVDPVKALEAVMDGFEVMKMEDAAKKGDIFVTVTGDINVIRGEHIEKMKDGAILANAGHFDVEISKKALEEMSKERRRVRQFVDEYTMPDGRKIYLLAEGRLVNLVAAEGHPPEVMDMSFANQALSIEYLVNKADKLERKVYNVPREIDEEVALLKLKSMNIEIDELTGEQRKYLESW